VIEYDAIAKTYASYRDASPAVIRHIRRHTEKWKPREILEIGCGTADHLGALSAAWGAQGHGFDFSAGMLEEGNRKNPGLCLQQGDASAAYPYAEQSFEFEFSINVIHYIKDLSCYFSEAWRVLKAGGALLTLTDSEEDIRCRSMSRYFPETVANELQRYPSIASIRQSMRAAGFKSIRITHMQRGYTLTGEHLEKFRNKAYSCLRLIPEEAFQAGMERATLEIATGHARGHEVYTGIWGIRL